MNMENIVMLAPMAGVADTAFRTLCRELGFRGRVFTEMVSAKGLCHGDKKSFELAKITVQEKPAAIQIFGSDPESITKAIGLLEESFAEHAEQFDINMGCPMPKVTRSGDGAALMLNPALAYAVVRAAVKATKKPVSVKIRKGWDGGCINAVEFAKGLEAAGAAMITVHGRTREQYYGGAADWRTIADVKRAVCIPIVGNGDIFRADDALRMLGETGCDGVMIGRAARGNPWLPAETENTVLNARGKSTETYRQAFPSPAQERINVIKRHVELAVLTRGERVGITEMRKHIAWYIKGFHNAAAIRNEIFKLTDCGQILRRIEQLGG